MQPFDSKEQVKLTTNQNQQIEISTDQPTLFTQKKSLLPTLHSPLPTPHLANNFWQRFLLVQGIGWIGGLGIVSGSIVWAQSQIPTNGILVAQIPDTMPKAVPQDAAPEAPAKAAPIVTRSTQPRLPQRNRTRRQNPTSQPVASNSNNSYIDPTDYSLGATNRQEIGSRSYEPPSAVVLSERSRGCRRVYGRNGVSGGCDNVASGRTRVRRNAVASDSYSNSRRQRIREIPRAYEISRQPRSRERQPIARSYPINRQSVVRQNEGLPNSYRIARLPVTRQSPYLPNSDRIARRSVIRQNDELPISYQNTRPWRSNQSDPAGGSRITWKSQRRPVAVAAARRVNIGPMTISSKGIGLGKRNIYSKLPAIGNNNTINKGITGNQAIPNPALNYYYNQANPPQASGPIANLPIIFPLAIPAQITSVFGWRIHPISGDMRFHAGTDIGAPMGTPVLAAYAGKVAIADFLGGYGLSVILRHNSDAQETRYAHLSEIFVKPGEWVEQGTVIGRVGSTGNSTGPHLHFEVREQSPQGWVAMDPGAQLENSLAQLVRTLKTAQAPAPEQPSTVIPNTPNTRLQTQIPTTPNTRLQTEAPLLTDDQLPEITIPKTVPSDLPPLP